MSQNEQARLTTLIAECNRRILETSERVEMVRLWWIKKGGTVATLKTMVGKAYAMAKKYDREGGSNLRQELDHLFTVMGCDEFNILYAAVK